MTMEQLAAEAEIEYRQLGRIERGEINTTVISLLRLAEALQFRGRLQIRTTINAIKHLS